MPTRRSARRRTRRRWNPNIQRNTYYLPSQGRNITLRVSTRGIKVIAKNERRRAIVARYAERLRKFGLSRVRVREMAHRGELPGIRKASW